MRYAENKQPIRRQRVLHTTNERTANCGNLKLEDHADSA